MSLETSNSYDSSYSDSNLLHNKFKTFLMFKIDFEIDDFSKLNEIVLNLAVSWFLGIRSRGYYLSILGPHIISKAVNAPVNDA